MTSGTRFVTRGIVLRETVTKESDKILTLLTPDHGKIALIAKGVRRKNSKFAACAQTLAYSEWTLSRRGDWYFAHDGSTLELFAGLRSQLPRMALGCYFAELTEAAAPEEVPAESLLRHLLNGLYTLSTSCKSETLVKTAFEWKFLSLAGYEPLADSCPYCGTSNPTEPVFDAVQGVVRCQACGHTNTALSTVKPSHADSPVKSPCADSLVKPSHSDSFVKPLCPDSLAALRHIVYGNEKRLYAFRLGPDALSRLSDAAETFVFTQMERKFRTLDFYQSLTDL